MEPVEHAAAPSVPRRWTVSGIAGDVAFWILAAACASYLLYLGRRTTFFYDEWSWIQQRRGWSPGNFLRNHNGHCSILPVFAYHVLFATAGLRSYLPYRIVLMVVHTLTAYSLYRYGRPRIGPLLSLAPAGMVLLIGVAWQDLMWPLQIGFLGALGLGMAALVLLDGPDIKRRNIGACLCLLAAVSCSGIGLPLLAGAAVRSALGRQWRRWWVFAVPGTLYVAWFAGYGLAQRGRGSARQMLTYFGDSYRAGVGALTGHDAGHWHGTALVLGIVLMAAAVTRGIVLVRRGQSAADLISVVATGIVLWALTAVTRAQYHDAGASRYLYIDAFLILAALIEVVRGIHLRASFARRAVTTALAVAAVASTWTGLTSLHNGARSLRSTSTYVRAELAALEHSKPAANYHPDRRRMPVVTAGQYLAARRDLGSPALAWSDIPAQSPGVGNQVDRVLLQAGGNLIYAPATARRASGTDNAPTLTSLPRGRSRRLGSCIDITPVRDTLTATLAMPHSVLTIATHGLTHILGRRFGRSMIGFVTQGGDRTATLHAADDGSSIRWTIEIGSDRPISLCD